MVNPGPYDGNCRSLTKNVFEMTTKNYFASELKLPFPEADCQKMSSALFFDFYCQAQIIQLGGIYCRR